MAPGNFRAGPCCRTLPVYSPVAGQLLSERVKPDRQTVVLSYWFSVLLGIVFRQGKANEYKNNNSGSNKSKMYQVHDNLYSLVMLRLRLLRIGPMLRLEWDCYGNDFQCVTPNLLILIRCYAVTDRRGRGKKHRE